MDELSPEQRRTYDARLYGFSYYTSGAMCREVVVLLARTAPAWLSDIVYVAWLNKITPQAQGCAVIGCWWGPLSFAKIPGVITRDGTYWRFISLLRQYGLRYQDYTDRVATWWDLSVAFRKLPRWLQFSLLDGGRDPDVDIREADADALFAPGPRLQDSPPDRGA